MSSAAAARPSSDAAERRFSADATEVSAARRFLRETFDTWKLATCADAELVLSELMANAVRHGAGPPLVRLARGSDRVRIEVEDASASPPVLQRPDHDEPSGRGLAIIAAVALGWGHHPKPDGNKTVWAEVALS